MFASIVLTLSVLALALVCCVSEILPLDVVALSTAVLLMVLGLVTPEEGISGFGNPATVTVMAMFILSAGISRTGAIQEVNNFLLRWGGRRPSRQILTLGMIAGPVTAFINNTAVVAVFLPIIEDWCHKRNVSASKLLIPLSYVTILGGMITVFGTSTNILASGISKQLGYGEFSLFQFTKLGIITFVAGLIYLAFIAPTLLPNHKRVGANRDTGYDLDEYISEIIISSRSTLIGQTIASSCLKRSARCPYQRFEVDVLEIIRDGIHFSQPLDRKVLTAGDVLLVRSSREDLLQVKEEKGIEILPEFKFSQLPSLQSNSTKDEEGVLEVLVPSNSNLVGSTLKDLRFRQRYNATALAIRRGAELTCDRLSDTALRFGDVLLIQGPKQSLSGLQSSRDFLVLSQRDINLARRDKAGVAVAIGLGVVIVSALNLLPIMVSSLTGAVLMVLTGCLKPGELY
ncbi:MAG: SLC13 family permease, partial [Cyanobacteria bacterium J06641_5]